MRCFCQRSSLTCLYRGVKCRGRNMTETTRESNGKAEMGGRIRTARLEAHLTIPSIARELGVNERTVSGWQAGRSLPRYEMLVRLADLLGKPLSYFLEGEEIAA